MNYNENKEYNTITKKFVKVITEIITNLIAEGKQINLRTLLDIA